MKQQRILNDRGAQVYAHRAKGPDWNLDRHVSDAEKKEIERIWSEMPGNTCWMNAFFAWATERIEGVDPETTCESRFWQKRDAIS